MTYTDHLLMVLHSFESRGSLHLSGRTLSGIGETAQHLPAGQFEAVPLPLTAKLLDGFSFRLSVVSWIDATPAQVPALVALFRPACDVYGLAPADAGGSALSPHVVLPEACARITAALATMPAPTVLVDAGPEVWAGWRLRTPLPVADARPRLVELAERLGAEPPPEALEDFTVPLCGPIRNWNAAIPEQIVFLEVDPARVYTPEDLSHPPSPKELSHEGPEHPAASENRGRVARRA